MIMRQPHRCCDGIIPNFSRDSGDETQQRDPSAALRMTGGVLRMTGRVFRTAEGVLRMTAVFDPAC
jgi:hypothetical protein